jgi:hypothetical protein
VVAHRTIRNGAGRYACIHTRSEPLGRTLAAVLAHNLFATLVLACVVMFSLANAEKVSAARPAPDGSARALVEAHACGEHVTEPTHAVVTVDGVTRYVGQRMTERAIEQAVFGIDHGLTVHGFCS